MRARRVVGIGVALIAFVLLLGAGIVWWLMSTEAGSRRVVAFLLGKSPEGLEVAEIHGSLVRQLRLNGIRYRSGALSTEIDSAMLDLRPSALIRGRLMLEQVRVAGMRVTLPDSTPRDTAGTAHARRESPRPPIPIEIGEGTITGFQLDAPSGIAVRDGKIAIVGALDRYRFDLSGTVFIPQVDTTGSMSEAPGLSSPSGSTRRAPPRCSVAGSFRSEQSHGGLRRRGTCRSPSTALCHPVCPRLHRSPDASVSTPRLRARSTPPAPTAMRSSIASPDFCAAARSAGQQQSAFGPSSSST
jgi:hypothetical protein